MCTLRYCSNLLEFHKLAGSREDLDMSSSETHPAMAKSVVFLACVVLCLGSRDINALLTLYSWKLFSTTIPPRYDIPSFTTHVKQSTVAGWDVVPFQTIDTTFNIGVVAFHVSGVKVCVRSVKSVTSCAGRVQSKPNTCSYCRTTTSQSSN